MPVTNIAELNSRFAIPNVLRFEADSHGLTRIAVASPLAEAHVYLLGAHVTHFQPRGQKPVLFMSSRSMFEVGKPIRGGIPVIFPWFGPRGGEPGGQLHGIVRTMEWSVESIAQKADGAITIVLQVASSEQTRATWPHDFHLRYTVTIGAALEVAMEAHNPGPHPFTYEEALHTYFAVADVRQSAVEGLDGVEYFDKVDNFARKVQKGSIGVTAETDRLYVNTSAASTITDPGNSRRIEVRKAGSRSTCVWNPWVAKAKAMPDFGDDEWPAMICVETCNARDAAITLHAGQTHVMSAEIKVL